MIETLQLERVATVWRAHDVPRLLVEWTPRWRDFVTSIGPALGRSEARLAGEAPVGLVPYGGMATAWLTEALLLFIAIAFPLKLAQMRRYVPAKPATHDVIYYTGDELPRTQDLGGAKSGATGRAGGREAHHATQTIRLNRGGSLMEKVVDVHGFKLPSSPSNAAVANLLAIRPNPGAPPVEGVRSARPPLVLPPEVLAPPPEAARDRSRGVRSLDAVVAPPPQATQNRTQAAPELNSVVAPPPAAARDKARSAPELQAQVVPPAPGAPSKQVSRSPVLANSVVPPPVSAPERADARDRKLTLPAPSVVAPPPSADTSTDLRHLASGNAPDRSPTVVPPPPTQSGASSFVGNLLGRLFGSTDVVPPPPAAASAASSPRSVAGSPATVLPPPPTATTNASTPARAATGSLTAAVVPPPPSASETGKGGTSTIGSRTSPTSTALVPPPPSADPGSHGNGAGIRRSAPSTPETVVPPPPTFSAAGAPGAGRGGKGSGSGSPLDVGAVEAPAANGGSGGSSAVVVSNQPGSKVALPGANPGSLAMSPRGTDKPGLGGTGGGASIATGAGPGSGLSGEHSGAGKTGTGLGSDPKASNGISTANGPGGAGNAGGGTPPVPGVDIQGGSGVVIVGFEGTGVGGVDPSLPGRSTAKGHSSSLGVSVQGTATSGGALDFYGKLSGEQHTIYLETSTPAVMSFADAETGNHAASAQLIDPQPIRTELPPKLPRSRVVFTCILNASGNLTDIKVYEAGPPDETAKVMAALSGWKFSPAQRGDRPIAVTAFLGFNIDTNDRRK